MSGATVRELYGPSPVKRSRSTAAQMEERQSALLSIVSEMQPMTVRQVFYQASVRGIVDKLETGYRKVQADLVALRRRGCLPWHSIVDNTRWQRKPRTYADMFTALHETAQFYRRDLWRESETYVELWLEKDALAGVIEPVTSRYDVPLMVARGYASLSFLYSAAEAIAAQDRPTFIYHFGDSDPSGVNAAESIERELRKHAPNVEICFERVAVTERQIHEWNLPTRPTKKSDSRAKKFGEISAELDAIDPNLLRALVQSCIDEHMPADRLAELELLERLERESLMEFARNAGKALPHG